MSMSHTAGIPAGMLVFIMAYMFSLELADSEKPIHQQNNQTIKLKNNKVFCANDEQKTTAIFRVTVDSSSLNTVVCRYN